jgi:hypothetical protein
MLAGSWQRNILRVIQEELSMFEQYLVRPLERRHIAQIWLYRIVCKEGTYYFGKVMTLPAAE